MNSSQKDENIFSNSDLTPKLIEKYCKISKESEKIIKASFEKLNLSMRGYYKILKVARTIADLSEADNIDETIEIINNYSDVYATIGYHPEEADNIEKMHIMEAIQFKTNNNLE